MSVETDKALKDAEVELAKTQQKAQALEKEIHEAEAKRPPELDHADDGGVI